MTYRATFLSLCLMCAACPCTFLPHPCVRPVRPATCSLLSSRFTLVSCPCRAIVLVIVMAWQFMCHVLLPGLYLDVVLVLSLSCVLACPAPPLPCTRLACHCHCLSFVVVLVMSVRFSRSIPATFPALPLPCHVPDKCVMVHAPSPVSARACPRM